MSIIFGMIGWTAIGIICVLALLVARGEAKTWNNGVCRTNGLPWTLLTQDSQGGRLYAAGEERTWISWHVDK